MQPMLFLSAGLLFLPSLTLAEAIIIVSPAQSSHISADIASYLSTLTTQANWVSVQSVLATAIPSRVDSEGSSAYLQQILTETALPAWYTAMPLEVQCIFSSVVAAEISILTKDLAAAAPHPTAALKVMGGVLAAGAAGLALL